MRVNRLWTSYQSTQRVRTNRIAACLYCPCLSARIYMDKCLCTFRRFNGVALKMSSENFTSQILPQESDHLLSSCVKHEAAEESSSGHAYVWIYQCLMSVKLWIKVYALIIFAIQFSVLSWIKFICLLNALKKMLMCIKKIWLAILFNIYVLN